MKEGGSWAGKGFWRSGAPGKGQGGSVEPGRWRHYVPGHPPRAPAGDTHKKQPGPTTYPGASPAPCL